MNKLNMLIPKYVLEIINILENNKKEAYIVGGCVRDILLNKIPKDWDITTNARPDDIIAIFNEGKYENNFGTVIIPIKKGKELIDTVEVTTFRSEQGYSDRRHPDQVNFEESLDKDLERRDFTVNAMALNLKKNKIDNIIDYFGGQKDLKNKIIRAVGEPVDRFKEDALRMMRAIRLACELNFKIEEKTQRAILKMAGSLKFIASERISDELIKIMKSDNSHEGIMMLHKTKLLQYILPEIERGVGVGQNRHHIYSVFNHLMLSLKFCPSKDWRVRFAALLHDIAKPETKKFINGDATFYNHDIIGARIAAKITKRLKFSNPDSEKIISLIKNHMFYYNVGEVSEASVRRLIVKVGKENLKDLIDLRIGDRLGSGVPKAKPYKLRHLEYMMEKVQKDPISVKMLKIDGNEIMTILNLEPGPKIGAILDVLLAEIIDNPVNNEKKHLKTRAKELNALNLEELRQKAKEKIEDKKIEDDNILKKEFWVK